MTRFSLPLICFLALPLAGCMAGSMASSMFTTVAPGPNNPPNRLETGRGLPEFVGQSEKTLIKELGEPDGMSATDETRILTYYWHTRDGVSGPLHEEAWHDNVAYVQRGLPTRKIPMRGACDAVFEVRGSKVTAFQFRGRGCN